MRRRRSSKYACCWRSPSSRNSMSLERALVRLLRRGERSEPCSSAPARSRPLPGPLSARRDRRDRSSERRAPPSPPRRRAAQTKPVTPSLMISGRPPTFDAITGTSHAMASSAARPKLSCVDGSRNRSATDSQRTGSCSSPTKRHVVCQAHTRRTRRSMRRRSGPSPISSSRARQLAARSGRNTSSTTSTRLTGRKFDMWTTRASHRPQDRARREGAGSRPPAVLLAVEKVGDDLDRMANAERCDRVGLQALRHRGDDMRLLDREADDPGVGAGRCRPA